MKVQRAPSPRCTAPAPGEVPGDRSRRRSFPSCTETGRAPAPGIQRELPVIKGFKDFILRGNVIELAVAVVMGAAFGAIVNALVQDIIMPLITAIFGKQDYNNLYVTLNSSQIFYGKFVTAAISFLLIAIAVYFCIVAPINHFDKLRKRRQGLPEVPSEETELDLLAQIRDAVSVSGRQ
jgi:large conductance mechanosensitive channel